MNTEEYYRTLQPCWDCAKSCGGCSWSRDFIPVDGWKAAPTSKHNANRVGTESYQIEYCPEYEKETPIDPQTLDTDGCVNLLAAYFETAAEDYKAALRTYMRMSKYLNEKSGKAMWRNVERMGECFPEHIKELLKKEVLDDERKAMA